MQDILSFDEITQILKTESIKLTSVTLTDRQLSDLELILNGGFNPLKSYLNKKDYDSVLKNMRLASGELWPIPINLDLSKEFIEENNLSRYKNDNPVLMRIILEKKKLYKR